MKTALIAIALVGLLIAVGCQKDQAAAPAAPVQTVSMTVPDGATLVSFDVPDMTCEGCCAHVQETLAAMEGVGECQVDLDSKTATCVIYPDEFQQEMALAKLADEGYKSTMKN